MKKILYMALAAIAALSSCDKSSGIIDGNGVDNTGAPVFTATIEADATTKTTLGQNATTGKYTKVNWENGDELWMFFKNSSTNQLYTYVATPNAGDPSKASLRLNAGNFNESLTYLYQAFYPCSLLDYSKSNPLQFPATQVYNGDKIDYVPLVYRNPKQDIPSAIQFRNPCALLAINVPHSVLSSVKSIKVSSDRKMNGGMSISSDGTYIQIDNYNKTPAAGENCITLDCYSKTGANVQIPEGGSKTFYVAIPAPSSYSDSNYGYSNLQIDVTDGTSTETIRTKSSGITVERNKIYNISFLSDLCFTAKQAGSTVGIKKTVSSKADIVFQYSTDNGASWTDYTPTETATEVTLTNVNDKVYFRRKNNAGSNLYGFSFTGTGNVAVSGSIMSLLSSDGSVTSLPNYAFSDLFNENEALTDASRLSLPVTTLTIQCYQKMFDGCTNLQHAPSLPATTLAEQCYSEMFSGCGNLQSAPALPATALADNCYFRMFLNCGDLKSAPALPATTLAANCYNQMFRNCAGLQSAPALPATTLAANCYTEMFRNCGDLQSAPALPATTLAANCYKEMFGGCTNLHHAPSLPATILANGCYWCMFAGCGTLESVYIYATDPAKSAIAYWLGKETSEGDGYPCYAGEALTGNGDNPVIHIKQALLNIFKNEGLTLDKDNIVTSESYRTIPKGWKVELL